MKAYIEQHVSVVLFTALYMLVLGFESVYETAVLSCGAVYYAVQGGSNF